MIIFQIVLEKSSLFVKKIHFFPIIRYVFILVMNENFQKFTTLLCQVTSFKFNNYILIFQFDESNLNNVSKIFDSPLRISITNKLVQLSGRINESGVSIGPSAEIIDQISEKKNEKITKKNPELNGTSSPRSPNVSFSVKKILLENEIQRKENVKVCICNKN